MIEGDERKDMLVKYVYTRRKHKNIDFKRTICRILVYPQGYEFVHNMCCTLFQGLGIDGSWFNIRPHGNAKGVEQFLGQINPQAKSIAFDLFDQNWTVTEVKNHMSKLDDPLKISSYHRVKYLLRKWSAEKDICCTGNPSMQLAHLVENMKNKQVKLVRSVIQSADGNPVVTICPDWVQLLMVNACGIHVKKIKTWTPSDIDVGKFC